MVIGSIIFVGLKQNPTTILWKWLGHSKMAHLLKGILSLQNFCLTLNSVNLAAHMHRNFYYFSNRNSVRKSYSESTNLNKENQEAICITPSERRPSLNQDEIERRLGYKDDSDYWSTPSSSIRYKKGM